MAAWWKAKGGENLNNELISDGRMVEGKRGGEFQ